MVISLKIIFNGLASSIEANTKITVIFGLNNRILYLNIFIENYEADISSTKVQLIYVVILTCHIFAVVFLFSLNYYSWPSVLFGDRKKVSRAKSHCSYQSNEQVNGGWLWNTI